MDMDVDIDRDMDMDLEINTDRHGHGHRHGHRHRHRSAHFVLWGRRKWKAHSLGFKWDFLLVVRGALKAYLCPC